MEDPFNCLIDSFIAQQVGIADNFLSDALAADLKANLIMLYGNKMLYTAGTGNNAVISQDLTVRGDRICWLDRGHDTPCEKAFFKLMDSFVSYLNQTCYTGITGYEFHYTLYEKGSFYKKHLDQFRNNDSRKYSMIIYLNKDWVIADGGELCIHHHDHLQNISPQNRKGVFFKSNELTHEVLLTHQPRMSITGWLKVNTEQT
ncbi:SM-20-related protein [Mucilaginibacter pineti]|uniref:SM-20-related protein n=1 Tax=Mucilaginibacter pineti TaxID=1391627 RepID=A0A1G7F2X7_9SPHI|nr:2OG-Fe(II) oxygenase [Mucilaginibacter pineti]SDE70257.1 SM-20-related protein [Mucilaginibacter pineti]